MDMVTELDMVTETADSVWAVVMETFGEDMETADSVWAVVMETSGEDMVVLDAMGDSDWAVVMEISGEVMDSVWAVDCLIPGLDTMEDVKPTFLLP